MKWNFKSSLNNFIISIFLITGFVCAQSPFEGLVIEQLNNEGAVDGTTYRLYAQLSEGKLYAIFADQDRLSLVETSSGSFFNSDVGSYIQQSVNPTLFGAYPNLLWDTWVTIGDTYDDAVSTVGNLEFQNFKTLKFAKISNFRKLESRETPRSIIGEGERQD